MGHELKQNTKPHIGYDLLNSEKFNSLRYNIGNKRQITLRELYDIIGFSEHSVICAECSHRGTLRKKGRYYEVVHTQAEKTTCYFGKDFTQDFILIPVRIIIANNE